MLYLLDCHAALRLLAMTKERKGRGVTKGMKWRKAVSVFFLTWAIKHFCHCEGV